MTPRDLEALRLSLTPTPAELALRCKRDRDKPGLLWIEFAARLGITYRGLRKIMAGQSPVTRRIEAVIRGVAR